VILVRQLGLLLAKPHELIALRVDVDTGSSIIG
jgi:hypothetical protein